DPVRSRAGPSAGEPPVALALAGKAELLGQHNPAGHLPQPGSDGRFSAQSSSEPRALEPHVSGQPLERELEVPPRMARPALVIRGVDRDVPRAAGSVHGLNLDPPDVQALRPTGEDVPGAGRFSPDPGQLPAGLACWAAGP